MKFLGARPQHEDLKLLVEDSDAVENNLAKFDDAGNPVDSGIASNAVPIATTQALTFYVNPSTGSDENDGSSGSPFKTIAKAVSMIPQIVNHNVTINLADGSYSEGITLSGYMGGGGILILGNGDHPENVVIAGEIYAIGCSVGYIELCGMKTTNPGSHGIYLANCSSHFTIDSVLCDTTDAFYDGVCAIGCPTVYIMFSTFSNRRGGISAIDGTTVISANNDGANNYVGLYADASTIMKYGTQPGGTTNEIAVFGGQILSSRLAERDEEAVEGNLAKFDSSGNPVDSGIASNTVPIATTADLTYYVNSSTGSDDNDGSQEHPFATITKAISMIPQIVNHNININISDGSYSEYLAISGYVGKGCIYISGNTINPENVLLDDTIYIDFCTCKIQVQGLKTTSTWDVGVYIYSCTWVNVSKVIAISSSYNAGIIASCSNVYVTYCIFSNRSAGIEASFGHIFSLGNAGSGNEIGLVAINGGVISKAGNQPSGTTNEFASSGGQILPKETSEDKTYYVNPSTGSDENDGSSGSPFATIAHAISLIPQIVNHTVRIYLADGNYSEGITLTGYVGKGIIAIIGNTTTPTNVVFSGQIILQGCHTRYINLSGLKTTYTASHAVYVASCSSVNLNKIVAIESASQAGVAYEYSIGTVQESTFSNRTYGIFCTSKSIIYSYNNDGESNTYGLYCNQASTIGKGGTQPSGTTGEYATLGGVIR